MWENRKIVLITIIIVTIISAGYGFYKNIIYLKNTKVVEENKSYQEVLANKEDNIIKARDAVEVARTTLDKQKDYIDNSILMKLALYSDELLQRHKPHQVLFHL